VACHRHEETKLIITADTFGLKSVLIWNFTGPRIVVSY